MENSPIKDLNGVQTTLGKWLAGWLTSNLRQAPLFEKEAAQCAQIVENPAAGGHVAVQLIQIKMNQLERLFAALGVVGASQRDIGFNLSQSFFDGVRRAAMTYSWELSILSKGVADR